MLRGGGAHLAAERSEEERSGAKWRGCGLGPCNTKKLISLSKQFATVFHNCKAEYDQWQDQQNCANVI